MHCSRSYIRVSEGRTVIWLTWFFGVTEKSDLLVLTTDLFQIPNYTGTLLHFSFAHPLVDRVVLAAGKRLLEVEHPDGRAGVDAAVVEHTIDRDVFPRSCHYLLGDVAHGCTHKENGSNFF